MERGEEGHDGEQPVLIRHASDEETVQVQQPDWEGPKGPAFKIVHPRRSVRTRKPSSGAQLHILSAMSALLGLMSLLLPWVVTQTSHEDEYFRLTYYLADARSYYFAYAIVFGLVLIGSMLSLLTSYGNLALLAGVVVFALDLPTGSSDVGVGFWLAAAAAVIGCVSIWRSPTVRVPDRFLSLRRDHLGDHRLNVLALSAFALGMISMTLMWFVLVQTTSAGSSYQIDFPLESSVSHLGSADVLGCIVAEALIVSGIFLCLLTPLGGLLMLSGTLLFLRSVYPLLGVVDSYFVEAEYSLGYGFYLCLVASAIATASMVRTVDLRIRGGSVLPSQATKAAVEPPPLFAPTADPRSLLTDAKVSLVGIARSAIKPAMVVALVLCMVVAAVVASYTMPWSTLVVSVTNNDASSTAEIDIYVDGELVTAGSASHGERVVAECSVQVGVHTVWLDYALLDYQLTGPDGIPDWTTSSMVRPFVRTVVAPTVLMMDQSLPQITMTVSDTPDGRTVSVMEAVEYMYGVPFPATVTWHSISVVLTDGTDFVAWPDVNDLLAGGVPVQSDLGYQILGDLNITCTVTDLAGDAEISSGDRFDLSVASGSFSPDVRYTFYVLYENGSAIGEVSFEG
jgi:hypothetical protein